MNKYFTEFIGTFFLVAVIGLTGNPLAIGSVLMVMIYMGGHVSGAHYNPAVTIGVWLRGKCPARDVAPYIAFQVAGALIAGCFHHYLTGKTFAPAPGAGVADFQALVAEIVFTFALVSVILNVATSKSTEGNSYYGLAIGFTVMASAFAVGGISGGAFNPAVGIGPIVIDVVRGTGSFSNLWLYLVGPVIGGFLASYAYRITNPSEFGPGA